MKEAQKERTYKCNSFILRDIVISSVLSKIPAEILLTSQICNRLQCQKKRVIDSKVVLKYFMKSRSKISVSHIFEYSTSNEQRRPLTTHDIKGLYIE